MLITFSNVALLPDDLQFSLEVVAFFLCRLMPISRERLLALFG
jgi:hypothetical protein